MDEITKEQIEKEFNRSVSAPLTPAVYPGPTYVYGDCPHCAGSGKAWVLKSPPYWYQPAPFYTDPPWVLPQTWCGPASINNGAMARTPQ